MNAPTLADDLALALHLADRADDISLSAFHSADFNVHTKPDMTLVTDADQAVERALREIINDQRPDDDIFGEEYGEVAPSTTTHRRWILDPIDGTHNFVRGVPVWATLIALEVDGQIVVGAVSAPALSRRWWASSGNGAFMSVNGQEPHPIKVSGVSDMSHASLSYSSLGGWRKINLDQGFFTLCDQVWRTRAYGDFWSYMLVAEGVVDIAAEPDLELYDMAALVPIVTEAGGRFTDLDGKLGPWGPNAIASNGLLHSQALRILHA